MITDRQSHRHEKDFLQFSVNTPAFFAADILPKIKAFKTHTQKKIADLIYIYLHIHNSTCSNHIIAMISNAFHAVSIINN